MGIGGFFTEILAFLVFNAGRGAEFVGKLLKLRWSVGIIGLELHSSASQTVSKRAGAPFVKTNGNVE